MTLFITNRHILLFLLLPAISTIQTTQRQEPKVHLIATFLPKNIYNLSNKSTLHEMDRIPQNKFKSYVKKYPLCSDPYLFVQFEQNQVCKDMFTNYTFDKVLNSILNQSNKPLKLIISPYSKKMMKKVSNVNKRSDCTIINRYKTITHSEGKNTSSPIFNLNWEHFVCVQDFLNHRVALFILYNKKYRKMLDIYPVYPITNNSSFIISSNQINESSQSTMSIAYMTLPSLVSLALLEDRLINVKLRPLMKKKHIQSLSSLTKSHNNGSNKQVYFNWDIPINQSLAYIRDVVVNQVNRQLGGNFLPPKYLALYAYIHGKYVTLDDLNISVRRLIKQGVKKVNPNKKNRSLKRLNQQENIKKNSNPTILLFYSILYFAERCWTSKD